uniref:Small ribosomal subunit protein uS2c n=1 Tax=Chloroparvula japonica TaxID=1411623 RepID=A0A4D6C347_9CHLO|nr:ribosomal protein S2 [Chloroparvula japonica]QBX98152.1 ribosomal protein S2 [Chloroparvula japonica]
MKTTTKSLLKSGVHLGHSVSHWHPKMAPHIYQTRAGVHIIDLIQTQVCIAQARQYLTAATKQGYTTLFVGTKPQVSQSLANVAKSCNSFYINQRWLGGLLTNWKTLRQSVTTLAKMEMLHSQGLLTSLPKRRYAAFMREYNRLSKYLAGVCSMTSEPDVVVVVGQQEEQNAINECNCLGIRTLTLLDTNSNPAFADLYIPASDDSAHGVPIILNQLANAINIGRV